MIVVRYALSIWLLAACAMPATAAADLSGRKDLEESNPAFQ